MKIHIIFCVCFVFVLDIKQIILWDFGQFTAGAACTIYFEIHVLEKIFDKSSVQFIC